MENETSFLINLSAVLIVALVLGLVTARLRLSPIVGYLLGGIILGPQTPGFIADPKMAREFAEIGVILLMFGVGLHFRPRDLWAVRKIAIPGAVGQIIVSIALAVLIVLPFGLDPGQGLFIGIAISVASRPNRVENLMMGFMDTDEVSLKGSPTVSPMTAALWNSVPLPPR